MEKFNWNIEPIEPIVFPEFGDYKIADVASSMIESLKKIQQDVITNVLRKLLAKEPEESDFNRISSRRIDGDFFSDAIFFDNECIGRIEILYPRFNDEMVFDISCKVRFTPLPIEDRFKIPGEFNKIDLSKDENGNLTATSFF